jgi:hypothetical protein
MKEKVVLNSTQYLTLRELATGAADMAMQLARVSGMMEQADPRMIITIEGENLAFFRDILSKLSEVFNGGEEAQETEGE